MIYETYHNRFSSIRHRHQIPPFNHKARKSFSIFYVNCNQSRHQTWITQSKIFYLLQNYLVVALNFEGISQHSQKSLPPTYNRGLQVVQYYFPDNFLAALVATVFISMPPQTEDSYGASCTSCYTTEEKQDSYSTLSNILQTKCSDELVQQVILDMMAVCADITDALRVNLVTVEGSANVFGDSQLSVDVSDEKSVKHRTHYRSLHNDVYHHCISEIFDTKTCGDCKTFQISISLISFFLLFSI